MTPKGIKRKTERDFPYGKFHSCVLVIYIRMPLHSRTYIYGILKENFVIRLKCALCDDRTRRDNKNPAKVNRYSVRSVC